MHGHHIFQVAECSHMHAGVCGLWRDQDASVEVQRGWGQVSLQQVTTPPAGMSANLFLEDCRA